MPNSSNQQFPFLDLSETTRPFSGRLKEAAARVIDSGRFLSGEETAAFEHELANYLATGYCIGVSNGLDAIRLILRAWIELGRLAPGDEILVAANTYIASLLPMIELGLHPVLVPPSPLDFNLDFSRIDEFITPRTKGIMLVHLYGNPCWDAEICHRLHERGLLIIEDNAQAIGAAAPSAGLSGSRMTGALGDAAAISFYPTKNLGALGDAGAVATSDEATAKAVRALANYGSDRRYHNIYAGYNNRIDELQAAFLRIKLADLDEETSRRQAAAAAYDATLNHPDLLKPTIFTDRRQVWHQYVVRSPRRDELKEYLSARGVATDIHYAVPPHLQPCLKGKFTHPSLSITEQMADTLLSLPIANITPADAQTIARIINEFPLLNP